MSYHEHTSALAREMAWLATSRATTELDVAGVRAAAASRGQVLSLLRTVLADVAPTPAIAPTAANVRHTGRDLRAARVPPFVGLVEHAPVLALTRTLEAHPDLELPAGGGAAERARVSLASPAGRTWVEVGVRAMHADHQWRTGAGALSPQQRWSAVADVAALAQTVSMLDEHLYARVKNLPSFDPTMAVALEVSTRSGLRVAGAMAQAVASTGELPAYATTAAAIERTSLLDPHSPADLPRAQARLAAQVRAAVELSPDSVVIIAASQATVARTAEVLLRGSDPARSRFASAMAYGLEDAAAGGSRLAATTPGDDRPVTQAAAITRYVVAERHHWRADPAAVAAPLSAALQASPLVVSAIAEHSARAAASGAWLATGHEVDHESAYPWRALAAGDPTPRLVSGLETIAARATTALVRASTPTYQPAKPAREVLADVNALATRARPYLPTTAIPDRGSGMGR